MLVIHLPDIRKGSRRRKNHRPVLTTTPAYGTYQEKTIESIDSLPVLSHVRKKKCGTGLVRGGGDDQ